MALNIRQNVVVSVDLKGMIEYWDNDTFEVPNDKKISFKYKSETDLYELAKHKTQPCLITMSPNDDIFVIVSIDKLIRIFDFRTGILSQLDSLKSHFKKPKPIENYQIIH